MNTIPNHIAQILAEARHDPSAYRKLRDYNPHEFRRDPALARFCEATHAYAGTRQRPQHQPSGMFKLGPERVRQLVSPQAVRWLSALEQWQGGSLVVCGGTGLGKTAALVWWCLANRQRRWQWVDGYVLGHANRRHALGEGAPELIDLAVHASVLIVDDPDHARDRDPFIEVMRERYAAGTPTFIATGKRWAELDQFYGDALLRRMVEGTNDGAVVDLWSPAPPR